MKKVGILNVQWVDNYGAVLLAYALQTGIENLGYDAEIIDYRPIVPVQHQSFFAKLKSNGLKGICNKAWNKIVKREGTKSVFISSQNKKEAFDNFRKKYLHRSKIYNTITTEDNLDYNTYVVGSDVVWKPDRICSHESDVYFLNFTEGKECHRITYAASIGTDDKEKLAGVKDKLKNLIQKFDCVSLREKTSIPFVQSLYNKEISWCIDPTMLLTAEDYDTLISQSSKSIEQGEYIYVYLFEDNEETYKLVNKLSKKMNLPVVCQCSNPDKIDMLKEYSEEDGPLEFVNRIKNAKLVVTDSFHGTVFSIIYNRDFYTISRGKISIRMQDLLTRLNLMNRYIPDPTKFNMNLSSVDYYNVDSIIDEWKKESIDYLKNALMDK
jgi:hypothetical protein